MSRKIIFLLLYFVVLIWYTKIVHADTVINAVSLQSDTSWNKDSSPYVITHDLLVPVDVTLTIESGVTVKIGIKNNINIDGKIIVRGDDNLPVILTSNQEDSYKNRSYDWGKIFIRDSTGSTFSNVIIHHSLSGVELLRANVLFDHVSFTDNDVGIKSDSSTFLVTNSQFTNTGQDVFNIISSTGNIASTTIDTMSRGFNINNSSTVTISTSTIKNALNNSVVVVSGGDVTINNVIIDGSGGSNMVSVSGVAGPRFSKITINNSVLRNGAFHGISISNFGIGIIDNSVIDHFTNNAVQQFNNGVIKINNSLISNSNNGIAMILGTGINNEITIASSSIVGNSHGAQIYNGSLSAVNNWWGDATGPFHPGLNPQGKGDTVSDNVLFSPWLTHDPREKCCSNVAFIPGLEASRLYKQQVFENQLWEPNRNDDVRKLFLDISGKSIDQSIYTRDIIDSINVVPFVRPNIYKSFIDMMNGLVSGGNITSWKALPYDWRLSINDISSDMVTEIEDLAKNSQNGKVTIISHSNGGLVAKMIMQELRRRNEENIIDKVIFVAVPQLGTPQSITALLHGYDQGIGLGFILNGAVARDFGLNMPGAYGLLPSRKYFERVTEPVVAFDSGAAAIAGYNAFTDYLLGKDGRTQPQSSELTSPYILNPTLLSYAENLHDSIDNWKAAAGTDVIQIAGWGVDTVKSIKYSSLPEKSFEPEFTIEGDKTVVYPSATGAASSTQTYYLNIRDYNNDLSILKHNRQHADVFEIKSLEDLLKNIVLGNLSDLPPYMSLLKPISSSGSKRLHVAVQDVSVDLYDTEGNHTGPVANPIQTSDLRMYEENIPNSYYLEMGNVRYSGFKVDAGNKVIIHGGESGTFTFKTETLSGDVVIASSTFLDIPQTPALEAELVIATSTATSTQPTLLVDVDGDGIKDISITPIDGTDPILFLQILKQTIPTLGFTQSVSDNLVLKIDAVLVSLNKIVGGVKTLSTQFQSNDWKTGKTPQEQQDMFVNMINTLGTSLN